MSVLGAAPKRAISWCFDATVMVAGGLVGLVAVFTMFFGGHFDAHWLLALLIGAPVTALMSRFPLILNRSASGIEVGFDSAVLVFLVCFDGGAGALGVWAVGQTLSQVNRAKRIDVRIFNIGLGILSGWVAVEVMRAVGALGTTTPRELVAVGLGCAAFFLVDYVVSAVSIALEDRSPLNAELRQSTGLAALGVFVAIDSLGYLAALVARELPPFTYVLLAVPVFTILVATRALSRGREHRRRLSALFDAAAEAQVVESPADLEAVLRDNARAAVASRFAELRADGPSPKEIGARVRAGSRDDVARRPGDQPGAGLDRGRPAGPRGAGHGGRGSVLPAQPDRRDGPPRPARRADRAAQPDAVPGPGRAGRDPGPSP